MEHTSDTQAEQPKAQEPLRDGGGEADPRAAVGHIRAAAYLCGLETAPLPAARVLELGCGNGRHLQAFALAHPEAVVVGVDLWPDELARGQREAEELGIRNLRLLPMLFTDIDPAFGQFDYIIVRDEYTWAPDVMREAILRICAQNLAPDGVACVGVHTYPGWRAGDTLRDAIQLHAHSATSLEELRAKAGAVLTLLVEGRPAGVADGAAMQAAARRLLRHPEYYISTDFLARSSAADYLLDMVGKAQQAGLAYVADALPETELASSHGNRVQLQHSLISLGQGGVVKQQYLDFAIHRAFRRGLFVREACGHAPATMERQRLAELHFACSLRRKFSPALPVGVETVFVDPQGQLQAFKDEMTVAVCDVLGSVWPHTLDFSLLLEATTPYVMPGADPAERRHALLQTLESLMPTGHLRYRREPGPYDQQDDGPLRLAGLVQNIEGLEEGERSVAFNLWSEPQNLSLERSPAKMTEILQAIHQGDGSMLEKHPELLGFIEHLKWHGLLLGSESAWLNYYAAVLATGEGVAQQDKLHYLPSYVAHGKKWLAAATQAIAAAVPRRETPPMARVQEVTRQWQQRNFEKLETLVAAFVKDFPGHEYGWHILGLMRQEQGDQAGALEGFLQSLTRRFDDPRAYVNLAYNLPEVKGSPMVLKMLGLGLWVDPRHAGLYVGLGNAFRLNEHKPRALQCFELAVALDPDFHVAEKNLSVLHGELGNVEQAVAMLRKCIAREPRDLNMHSNYLYNLSQFDGVSAEELFLEHLAFGRKVDRLAKKAGLVLVHENERRHDKRLRLGFVSGDLRNHAVARFVEPIWRELDKSAFEIHVYCTNDVQDDSARLLRSMARRWEVVNRLTDAQLARKIHDDGIDILFDLSGHTGYNRLPMFAYKPAPVQVSWIGYPGTTGLSAMDYYIVNKHIAPEGMREMEDQYVERLIRLPSVVSFDYSSQEPPVNGLPALKNGYVTFGSFNRISKINAETFRTWAEILKAVPNSRFLMGHVEADSFKPLRDIFASHGIAEDRLVFHPRATMAKYLALHHQVDMLLDTFPYNGGTTTYYGLWMGVPTLTLAGRSIPSRTGVAILGPLGLGEFVAGDRGEYVEKAVQMAGNLPRLAELRASARGLISSGSIMSHHEVARSLERALRLVWSRWCDGEPPRHVSVD